MTNYESDAWYEIVFEDDSDTQKADAFMAEERELGGFVRWRCLTERFRYHCYGSSTDQRTLVIRARFVHLHLFVLRTPFENEWFPPQNPNEYW